jgi:sec-independent protein translocase protein TatA
MTACTDSILALNFGPTEWIVVLVVALLIWGRRLPEIARSMGKSVSEFKKGIKEAEQAGDDVSREIHKAGNEVTKDTGTPYNKTS